MTQVENLLKTYEKIRSILQNYPRPEKVDVDALMKAPYNVPSSGVIWSKDPTKTNDQARKFFKSPESGIIWYFD
jgi:hypothetical protein